MFDVPRPLCFVLNRRTGAGKIAKRQGQIGYCDPSPATDVENIGCLRSQRKECIRRDHVCYINEVSSLHAVAKNRNRLIPECLLNKGRNGSGIFTCRILVGTKDVKITKANSGESFFICEGAAMPFRFILPCGIGTFRVGWQTLDFWNYWTVAINC